MKRKIVFIVALVLATGLTLVVARGDDEPAMKLKDKPAPAISTTLLSGGKFALSDYKGKNVVILDFWATWCGPCVQGLPIVAQVAKDHADKGVIFFAVNQQESANDVSAFLKKQNLDIPVAMDPEGKVGEAYLVNGIPQTVIIGKDGVVKSVDVGISDTFKDDLTHELDKILAAEKK